MFKVWWDIDICLFYKFTTECVRCAVEFFVCKYFAVVVQGLCGPRKNTLCEFFCVAVVLHLPGVGRCSVEFLCV